MLGYYYYVDSYYQYYPNTNTSLNHARLDLGPL